MVSLAEINKYDLMTTSDTKWIMVRIAIIQQRVCSAQIGHQTIIDGGQWIAKRIETPILEN